MNSFIRNAACTGRKPEHLARARCRQRSALTAQLLRERSVARFIVAPDGFGKTAAALEYADVVFGFDHMFWIRCDSPCFLRDLDAGVIAREIKELEPGGALVVFEDLPRFDDDRKQRMSALIDVLLEAHCEVIVTCVPSCDSYGDLQLDRICLGGETLLVSDEELLVEGDLEDGQQRTPSRRIPCIVWSDTGEKTLIDGLRREELPADLIVGALVLMMLGHGTFEELEAICGRQWAARIVEGLADAYPYAGINEDEGTFISTPISTKNLASGVGRSLVKLVGSCPLTDRDQLIARVADTLLSRGESDRASEILVAFSSVKGIDAWTIERGYELLFRGALGSLIKLHRHMIRRRQSRHSENDRVALIAYGLLGDTHRCREIAYRILAAKSIDERMRCLGWITVIGLASDEERPGRAQRAWNYLKALKRAEIDDGEGAIDGGGWSFKEERLILMQMVASIVDGSQRALAKRLEQCATEIGSVGGRLYSLIWVLGALGGAISLKDDGVEPLTSVDIHRMLTPIVNGVIDDLERSLDDRGLGVLEAALAASLIAQLQEKPYGITAGCSHRLASAIDERSVLIDRERKAYGRTLQRELDGPGVSGATAAAALHKGALIEHAPVMDVTLFGGFSITIENRVLGLSELNRQKSRQLLALLILHHGREIPRDRLAELLWPQSDGVSASKNLYSAWSKLKRAVQVDGSCPYLMRSTSGFRLQNQLVNSDVYRFEEFCRSLMFPTSSSLDWQEVFRRVTEEFSEDLLPGERDCPELDRARERYRSQLVDSLINVSAVLERSGEAQGAIWFAREAIARDQSREDAHIALMRAQISADQRSNALETYFNCRSYLADQLGIDPSPTIIGLYRSIIEEEISV